MAELIESVEKQPTVKETTQEVRRSRSGFWFGLIILLVIAAVAGTGYYFLSQLRDKQEGLGGEVKGAVSQQISDYQAQLAAIQSQLAAVQTDVGNKEAHFTNSVTEFSNLQNEKLDATRKDLSKKFKNYNVN